MLTIGELARRAGVKVPTIRYYEGMGLLRPIERTTGNQRRYDRSGLDRLRFIKHARDLGFSLENIRLMLSLQDQPEQSCAKAADIATAQRAQTGRKIAQLMALQAELDRIIAACTGPGCIGACQILTALGDHYLCADDHA